MCTRLDRVGRSTAHLVSLLDEFRQRDVAFRFLEQGIDTRRLAGDPVRLLLKPRNDPFMDDAQRIARRGQQRHAEHSSAAVRGPTRTRSRIRR
ncbi:recombinase family protein [Saccharopolyspora shandongensis]|uniref:recombinase family protein n=1 Tax=Saccharopolyspora shandongensis TaxID=418495 RepID=UPI0034015293